MMRNDFLIYLGLLLVSLTGAYYVSLPRTEILSGQVQWIDVDPKSIESVEWKSGLKQVIAKRFNAEAFMISLTEPDKDAKEGSAKVVEFRANEKFDEFLKFFRPLVALREIGKAADLKLADYGLDASDLSEIVLKSGDGDLMGLKLGSKAFGSRNVFALDVKAKVVLLLDSEAIENFEKAKLRMMQKNAVDLGEDGFDRVALTVGEKTLTLTKKKSAEVQWIDSAGKSKAGFANFVAQILKVTVEDYATAESEELLTKQVQIMQLALQRGSSERELVRLVKDAEGQFWIKTRQTLRFAKINKSKGESFEKDATTIVGS